MNIDYIVVQAGGKGTRLKHLTRNRPKSLVPVNNLPILFHLFRKYPEKKFIVIGDYKFDVMARYLEVFATVDYMLIHAEGEGNAAGLDKALSFVPENAPFMLIWSDILLGDTFNIDSLPADNYIGVTNQYPCSWTFENGVLRKEPTLNSGVAGCFLFKNKSMLHDLPQAGSFTKYLQQKHLELSALSLEDICEVGTLEEIERIDSKENRCRPYNRITMSGEKVIKEGITQEAQKLIEREVKWYKTLDQYGFEGIPKVYSLQPLTIARIHGENIFRVNLNMDEKRTVLDKLCQRLNEMHDLAHGEANYFDMQEDYYTKTMKRIRTIRDVIPFSEQEEITINGRQCKNVLCRPEFLQTCVDRILTKTQFGIIHGDCTLTNTLIDENLDIYFIDARGYFGKTELIGDVYYDWAKVYYSISGAFDQFNVKNFSLTISDHDVNYQIAPSGWEELTDYFLQKIPDCDEYRLKLIHAIVWLSLASHCWEDYDSLCLAFYNGLYLLNTLDEE